MYQQPSERARDALRGGTGHFLNTLFVGAIAASVAGVAVWLLAFGGANGIRDSAERVHLSSSSPWITIASKHQDVADSAVLNVGDLPPGWVVLPDEEDDSEPKHELSDYCKTLDKHSSEEGVDASASSDNMGGPENQHITADAAVFSSSEDAQRALDSYREFFSRCGPDYIAQFEEGLRSGAAKDGIVPAQLQLQTTMAEVGPPPVGESGLYYRISGTVAGPSGSFEFAVDLMAFRIGRMGGAFAYTQIGGLRPEEAQLIAQTAAAKLQTAAAALTKA